LVVIGFEQLAGLGYNETSGPIVVKPTTIRIVLTLAITNG